MHKTRYLQLGAMAAVIALTAQAALAQGWGGPLGMLGRYDANGDGKVSFAEYDAGRNDRFMDIDVNSDQAITQAEIDSYTAERRAQWQSQNGGNSSNGGGGGQHQGGNGGNWQKRGADDFVQADANHDGRITLDEYKAQSAAHFKQMDANHDGFIDANEAKAMMNH